MGLREFTSVPADPRDWGRWMRAQFITADTVAPNVITTDMIQDAQVTFQKIQDLSALSVLGRPVNSAGVSSAIVAANDGEILRRNGVSIGFGTVLSTSVSDFTEAAQDAAGAALANSATVTLAYVDATPSITAALVADSVDNSFLADMAADTIKGRANGAGTGNPTDLSVAEVLAILGLTGLVPVVGTYTPTLTIVANLDAATAPAWNYLRVGSLVIVGVRITLDATAAAVTTSVRATLPIASNLGANQDLTGVAVTAAVAGTCLAILPDTANDEALLQMISTDTANRGYQGIFMYRII